MSTERIIPAPGHTIVRDTRTGKVSYWQGEYPQSAADSTGVSTADYIHAMYYFLMQRQCRDVLMIGCGGGTLATMLARSGVDTIVVDLHAFSFDIARRYFHLPPTVSCQTADGVAWLKGHRHRFDAIVLDAFGEGGMPPVFMQPAFFRLARSRLVTRGGLFLMNVIVDNDEDPAPDNLVRALRKEWRNVRLLDTDGWIDRNAVIAAGAVGALQKPGGPMPPHPRGPKRGRGQDTPDWGRIR